MRNIVFWFFILCLNFCLYSKAIFFGYCSFDDNVYINEVVKTGLNSESILWAVSTFTSGNWIPLTWFTYLTEATLFGVHPITFHLFNLVIHTLNSVVLFIFVNKITETYNNTDEKIISNYWFAFFVSTIFAIHPQRAEAVVWISELKEVLCTLFYIISLIFYLKYININNLRFYYYALLFFTLALLAKPMAVSLPLILILLDVCKLKQQGKSIGLNIFYNKFIFIVFSVITGLISIKAQQSTNAIFSDLTVTQKIFHVFISYFYYLQLLFYPENLSIYYTSSGIADSIYYMVLSALIISGVSFFLIKQKNILTFGWYWFLLTLLPVIGVIKVGGQFIADRYTYLSHIGIYFILFYLINIIWRKKQNFRYLVLLVLFLWSAMLFSFSINYIEKWSNDFDLWNNALKNSENNFVASYNIGTLYLKENNITIAEQYLLKSVEMNPLMTEAYINLGIICQLNKKYDESIKFYKKALKLQPDIFEAWFNLSDVYFESNRYDLAIKCLRQCKRLMPENKEVSINLSILLQRQNN